MQAEVKVEFWRWHLRLLSVERQAPLSVQLTSLCFWEFASCHRGLSSEKNRFFFRKIKNTVLWVSLSPVSWKKQNKNKNQTLVSNQVSRCLYVFIYLDIYSVFCRAVCLPGCIPGISKTYMQSHKDQRPVSYERTLCSTLGWVPKVIHIEGAEGEPFLAHIVL